MNTLCENDFTEMGCDNANTCFNCTQVICARTTFEQNECGYCGIIERTNEYIDSDNPSADTAEPAVIIAEPSASIESYCSGECVEEMSCERCKMNTSEIELSDIMMRLYKEKPSRYLKVNGVPYPFIHGTKIIGNTCSHWYGYNMKQPDEYTMEITEYTGYEQTVKEFVSMKFNLNGDWVWRLSEVSGLKIVEYAEQNIECITRKDAVLYATGTLTSCLTAR